MSGCWKDSSGGGAAMDDDSPYFFFPSDSCFTIHIWYSRIVLFPSFSYVGSFPIAFNRQFHRAHPSTVTHHRTRSGMQNFTSGFCEFLSRSSHLDDLVVVCLCPVRLCETVGREGAAQVLDWARLDRQSTQRPAAERPPRNRLHWVHGPRHLAPRSLQWWTQPGASAAAQHSHRWGE